MNRFYFLGALALASVGGLTVVGCGDDTATGGAAAASGSVTSGSPTSTTTSSSKASSGAGTTTTTGTGAGSTSASTGGGSCSVADTVDNCQHGCEALYDCAALTCDGDKLCAGVTGDAAEKTAFIGTLGSGGCLDGCMGQMALFLTIVNPNDCQATVTAVHGGDAGFADFCDNGPPQN